eukprot:6208773-Pleurochrysis_carterae.AAC.1
MSHVAAFARCCDNCIWLANLTTLLLRGGLFRTALHKTRSPCNAMGLSPFSYLHMPCIVLQVKTRIQLEPVRFNAGPVSAAQVIVSEEGAK